MADLTSERKLINACKLGDSTEVKHLLSASINKSFQDETGQTAAHIAVCGGYVQILAQLIQADVNLEILNDKGKSALDVAKDLGQIECITMIENHLRSADYYSSQNTSTVSLSVSKTRLQTLKDLKLTIEYKHLKSHAPSGVLVVPSFDDLRTWHGVIFVRSGLYQGGVFKFLVKLPLEYNDHGIYPIVLFHNNVFNPYVSDSKTSLLKERGGINPNQSYYKLDLEAAYPEWNSTAHFLVTALSFVKKIFYLKDEDLSNYCSPANPEALQVFLNDKEDFARRVKELVTSNQDSVCENLNSSPLDFKSPKPEHEKLRDLILSRLGNKSETSITSPTEGAGSSGAANDSTSSIRPNTSTISSSILSDMLSKVNSGACLEVPKNT